jgi:carbon storage regulator
MLVLSRKVGESIKLADDIEITVLAVDHARVRLGIRAPRHIDVRRSTPETSVIESNRAAALPPDPAENKSLLTKAASEKNKQGQD